MSVPIKRLQGNQDDLTPAEIIRIRKAEEEIARGEFVEWKPGMFTKSLSPKVAAKKSIATRRKSAKPSSERSKKLPKAPFAETI